MDQPYIEPVYLMQFSANADVVDIMWVLERMVKRKAEGGAELSIQCQRPTGNKGLTVFISLKRERILPVADQMRFKKTDLKGNLREFSSSILSEFVHDKDDLDIFTSAEILAMTRYEINNLRASIQQFLPVSKIRLFEGQSVVEKLMHRHLITQLYPLHEPETLKRLCRDWWEGFNCLSAHDQPLDRIRNYFGEGVAFYFAFLRVLTLALILPTVIGIIHHYILEPNFYTHLFLCIVYLLWAFAFNEFWKRQSNELAYLWGTNTATGVHKEPRANHKGELVHDPVSGQLQPYYPRWKTLVKLYFFSIPLVIVCMGVAFWLMLESFWSETRLMEWTSTWTDEFMVQYVAPLIVAIPGVIYALLVWVANLFYRKLATRLTEWENHKTESQFERNRVTKLLLFEFVNNFLSIFYIAFYLQDIKALKWQVLMMLLVFQILNQVTEVVIPYCMKRWIMKTRTEKEGDESVNEVLLTEIEQLKCPILDAKHSLSLQADKEGLLFEYEGLHEDYLELFIQFGFVILFILSYPLASVFALLNNVGELTVDAIKLTSICRRQPVSRAGHIGAWQPAFRIMCSIAVVTNCALLYIMNEKSNEEATISWDRAFICVSLDHVLLAVQTVLGVVVPAFPAWVRIAMAKEQRLTRASHR